MFKCYHQLEHSDCGLTCVRMIARRYGKKIPVQSLLTFYFWMKPLHHWMPTMNGQS
ncbi:MAG: hypothetical protein K2M41_08030 [Muribaculaceae bacterium]|nr:hypothetical protein [Muribaculaceae bacterium]